MMVSTTLDRYDAEIVRLGAAGGSSPQEEQVEVLGKSVRGYCQRTNVGSYVSVDGIEDHCGPLLRLTLTLWVRPTRVPHHVTQTLASFMGCDQASGWHLRLLPSGRLAFSAYGADGAITATTPDVLATRQWHEVIAGYSVPSGIVSCGFRTRPDSDFTCSSSVGNLDTVAHVRRKTLFIGAALDADEASARDHFNGRMDSVKLHVVAPDQHIDNTLSDDAIVASWNFGSAVESTTVVDHGPHGLHGIAMNMPTRAIPGHGWTGRYMDFRAAPNEYSAIDFHDDDLADANWDPSFEFELPAHMQSGAYAVRLRSGRHVNYVPFVVSPRSEGPRHDAVVVLPTFTYQAYANERVGLSGISEHIVTPFGKSAEHADASFLALLRDHPEWGGSLYDRHTDGSGLVYSTRARPIVNMRPDYIHWETGGPRHLSADLHLLAWLNAKAIPHDVITDDIVDAEGVDALAPYAVAITGSHPEYCTERMLDALEEYVDSRGNLMYLGGNGYYWVTSVHKGVPHIIEVRRGYSGTRTWESEPGSVHHSTTGEPGGLWRHRGRPPNRLVGVGFAAHGGGREAGFFDRTEPSHHAEHAWIFEGVGADERIGDFGAAMGGAAGDELDRYSIENGSPRDAVVLASSRGHGDRYFVAIEELLATTDQITGTTTNDVRADMVYYRRPNGGSVFSVGSICWIASLMTNKCCNNVSTITENVVRRFMLRNQ
jgi:N,N-dimethylformamidase